MKLKIFIISLLIYIAGIGLDTYAITKDSVESVSMIGYEQGISDYKATISLKNNTSEEIRDVTFLIEYLDMEDVPMDYEVFTEQVTIASGMTKKIDIPAYEHSRNYVYYKSKVDRYRSHTPYKIRYEFKEYNTLKPDTPTADSFGHPFSERPAIPGHEGILHGSSKAGAAAMLIILILFLVAYVALFILVARMAQKRHRSPALWLFLSFVATPFLICIILAALGDNTDSNNRLC